MVAGHVGPDIIAIMRRKSPAGMRPPGYAIQGTVSQGHELTQKSKYGVGTLQ